MSNKSEILVFGDVMLDHYIYGDVTRISPEAPIPVVLKKKEEYILGGAANVAANLKNLGVDVQLVGIIGEDKSGEIFQTLVRAKEISSLLVRDTCFTTTCKSRVVAQNHQMLRVDTESSPVITHEHFESIKNLIQSFSGSIIIISDYNKGLCNKELCQWIISYANQNNIKVFVDPKENDWDKFKGAFLIKPNLNELHKVIENIESCHSKEDYNRQIYLLLDQLDLTHFLITKGGDGMTLVSSDKVNDIKPHLVDVYDVTGAGDTVISVLSFGVLRGKTIEESTILANEAAAYVVTKSNTYAIKESDLENKFNGSE